MRAPLLVVILVAASIALIQSDILADSEGEEVRLHIYEERAKLILESLETEGCTNYTDTRPAYDGDTIYVKVEAARSYYHRLIQELIECRMKTTTPSEEGKSKFRATVCKS